MKQSEQLETILAVISKAKTRSYRICDSNYNPTQSNLDCLLEEIHDAYYLLQNYIEDLKIREEADTKPETLIDNPPPPDV